MYWYFSQLESETIMDASLLITQKFKDSLSCSFFVHIKDLEKIPWKNTQERDFVKWNLKTAFAKIYGPDCTVEVYFDDECPVCGKELKDEKCQDPTCTMNYKTEEDVPEKDLKEIGSL